MSAINPKNLMMAISAGVSIGGAGLVAWRQAVAITIFVIIACSSVLVPVIAYLVAEERMRTPLDHMRH